MELQCRNSDVADRSVRKEFEDLCLMLNNWTAGYLRVLDERGVDWSVPHEFFDEFFHMMCPYIDHLHRTGNTRPELMLDIGATLVVCMERIVERCQQEEDILRLTGGWTDNEQEIKEHWEEENKNLSCRFQYLSAGGNGHRLLEDTNTEG